MRIDLGRGDPVPILHFTLVLLFFHGEASSEEKRVYDNARCYGSTLNNWKPRHTLDQTRNHDQFLTFRLEYGLKPKRVHPERDAGQPNEEGPGRSPQSWPRVRLQAAEKLR